ncbi:hypothetical protein [Bradyrhizobium sp. NBAIM08]|uniref:hypothetical protein n=1 Tax=Bradyrhizobium sp. NBAIM08 TaxID=2793815 RepID=UPI001CD63A97|nr:hypothetical protein [Bradyrhizobium sp. NBAIM08]MCA1476770.1 hypothetical protein [Bradyrhizobium sp. NBAIM08]
MSKLGLSRKCHFRTAAEVSRLRRMYPHKLFDELKLAFPGSNKMRLRKKANSLGITKARKPFATTGEVIDCIRARAFQLRLTMVDVDSMARTGIYFSRSQWRGHALNRRKILRAIEALDRDVTVKWR